MPRQEIVDAALAAAGALLIDACVAPPGSLRVVEQARERGVPVVLDAERDPSPTVRALVAAADHLVIHRAFGEMLTGAQDAGDIAAELWSDHRAAIVLTEGTCGAHGFASPDRGVHVPAFVVDAVDTTGCGDAFHAGYAWALVSGADLAECMRIGSASAAVLAGLPAGATRVSSRAAMDAYLV